MVRSGPAYYFSTIEELLDTAQRTLFERARTRYRAGLAATSRAIDVPRLLDLTTAIYYREALEFGSENVAYYSVWMRAAQNPSLRSSVASSLLSFHHAWSRRIAQAGASSEVAQNGEIALRMQAAFVGKLIRTIVTAPDVTDLSWARADFAASLQANREGTH